MESRIHTGDCREIMRSLADCSIDAVITDPPYGLRFMGKAWDRGIPGAEFWAEMLRCAKPGAHLLAFGGTRTHHRMMCAIEDAGWELRDTIMWIYGSGFPKSHNLSDGRGTALKPAWEPIIMARKPLMGTVASNVERYGTGVLNIDLCRIETDDHLGGGAYAPSGNRSVSPALSPTGLNRPGARAGEFVQPMGRWPANVIHDGSDEVLATFPEAPGQIANASTSTEARKNQNAYGAMRRGRGDEPSAESDNGGAVGFKMRPGERRLDAGSAARFFYCAKASRKDRNEGLDSGEAPAVATSATMRDCEKANWPARNGNHHPTVKPTQLMRHLCRLVTPSGGTILDPFCGSGSTGKAAVLEWCNFIGIDMEAEYTAIAERRIAFAQRQAA